MRGIVKSFGERISKCSTASFHKRASEECPARLRSALGAILQTIEQVSDRIKNYDAHIEKLCAQKHPHTLSLRAVSGVGAMTALAYLLSLEEAERFKKSRSVGSFLGLTPRQDQSDEQDKQLRITKAGDRYVRRLLVGSAHYIMGPFGPDCLLRRFGLKLAERGGQNAKKRAVVAVAGKLSVLLHALWRTGDAYDPFYKSCALKA